MDPEEAWNKIHREAKIYEDVNIDLLKKNFHLANHLLIYV